MIGSIAHAIPAHAGRAPHPPSGKDGYKSDTWWTTNHRKALRQYRRVEARLSDGETVRLEAQKPRKPDDKSRQPVKRELYDSEPLRI
jgi:hypothetical protein